MLRYAKQILTKVSFDKNLFEKELKKSMQWLPPDQNDLLEDWCYKEYGNDYASILNRCFRKSTSAQG